MLCSAMVSTHLRKYVCKVLLWRLSLLVLCIQVATKAGVLNVPEWYEAGSVWVQNNPGFPFGEQATSCASVKPKLRLS